MSETWIDWRVLFERDMKIPGFKERFEAAKAELAREMAAEKAAGRFVSWGEILGENKEPTQTQLKRVSLFKIRKSAKTTKRSAPSLRRTRAKKVAQI